jgi:hypothetical protein
VALYKTTITFTVQQHLAQIAHSFNGFTMIKPPPGRVFPRFSYLKLYLESKLRNIHVIFITSCTVPSKMSYLRRHKCQLHKHKFTRQPGSQLISPKDLQQRAKIRKSNKNHELTSQLGFSCQIGRPGTPSRLAIQTELK